MSILVASKVPFHQFANLLEKITKINSDDKKRKLLKDFISQWRNFYCQLQENKEADMNDSFYDAFRLLLPHLDREREAYGIKEHTLAKLCIEIFGLGKDSVNSEQLLNYKIPKVKNVGTGDFGEVAYWVLKNRCCEKGTLMISEINFNLDIISEGNVTKDRNKIRTSLRHLIKNTSAKELKWLIRILLKDLKLGLGQKSIFKSFHEDAEDLYNVKMSLKEVCTILKDPSVRLHEIEITLFTPFRPMLGQKESPDMIEKLMNKRPYLIEVKFDGERMQMHFSHGQFKYFSRGGNDYSHVYGVDQYEGNFTPFIVKALNKDVSECILDGEMLGFDPQTRTMGTKAGNFDIKSANLNNYQPMFCPFDILLFNKKVLTNLPLRDRRLYLRNTFKDIEGRIVISETKECCTNKECTDALNEAIDNREEGIVVKDPESIYKPNCRNKGGWYKMKPDYVGGLMDELDVLLVGAYFGIGSLSGMVSHFLCAVAREDCEHINVSDLKPRNFYTFCKVGSGYTHAELLDLNARLVNHFIPFDRTKPLDWLHFANGFKQKPDVILSSPDHAIVLQVKATEIVETDQYKTGCTLRFPRVEKIRYDKAWYQCMNIRMLQELREKNSGKLSGRHFDGTGDVAVQSKSRKRGRTINSSDFNFKSHRLKLGHQFCGIDSEQVEKKSDFFSGLEFCVITGNEEYDKLSLERMIIEAGGSIVQNQGDKTFCIISGKMNVKIRNAIKQGKRDIVKVEWLLVCSKEKKLLDFSPDNLIYCSEKTKELIALNYDIYGDTYFNEFSDISQLKKIFDKMEGLEKNVMSEEISEFEESYFPISSNNSLFRLCRLYLLHPDDSDDTIDRDAIEIMNYELDMTSIKVRLHGGEIVEQIDDEVTHVIVMEGESFRDYLRMIEDARKDGKRFHLVIHQWVDECIEQKKLVNERTFRPYIENKFSLSF